MTTPFRGHTALNYQPRQAIESVFANIRHNHRLDRFSLRGREKVDAHWKLFCMVHNIGKIAAKRRTG